LPWRRGILSAVLERKGSAFNLPNDSHFNTRLEKLPWGNEPLFLIMAALLAAGGNLSSLLALNRSELVMEMADKELTRLRGFAGRVEEQAEILCRLAACATLTRGLSREQAMELAEAEKKELGYDSAGSKGSFANWLYQALPGQEKNIAPILPDLLGEAVILKQFTNKISPSVARSFDLAPKNTAETLVHCVQDYCDPSHPKQHRQPIDWLAQLISRPALDLEQAMAIANAVPLTSIALKELAVKVRQGIVKRLREEIEQEQEETLNPLLASSLNNLGVALNDLGNRKEALAATEEAVAIHRELAAAHPDAFRPDLATSLNNLGIRLDALGRREEALAATEEAVAIRRELAAAHPDAFRPVLAMSLNNLGIRLDAMGRREEALAATEEAVALYRQLAAAHPDAFRPDLAMSLNNLGNLLSALGRREEALAASEEAVVLYRELAAAHPDAFRPDLATSLNNLGIRFDALGRREEALAATEEAVALYRELAAAHPDAFRPDLAISLNFLSDRHHAFEQHREAQLFAQEAVEMLSPYFLALPLAHGHRMGYMVQDYLERCEDAGIEPDIELLLPIEERLQQLQSQ
uniref:tetratricopeptide repeat protein n=1 Tax=Candidatus Magnetaquicoccus inordinatus TaxID=2496818 RepID=UPI00102CD6C9